LYWQTDLDYLTDMYTLLFVGTRTRTRTRTEINAMMKLKVDFF